MEHLAANWKDMVLACTRAVALVHKNYLMNLLHCYTDFLEGVHLDLNCKVV